MERWWGIGFCLSDNCDEVYIVGDSLKMCDNIWIGWIIVIN